MNVSKLLGIENQDDDFNQSSIAAFDICHMLIQDTCMKLRQINCIKIKQACTS
jgi:hypothetical protein